MLLKSSQVPVLMKVGALCTLVSLFNGTWHFGADIPPSYDPWKECPLLSSDNSSAITDHKEVYSCKHSYKIANYRPHDCSILSIAESVSAMKSVLPKKKLYYVGDSLIRQLYGSARCSSEALGKKLSFNTEYFKDVTLRDDFPCHESCRTNSTYREANRSRWYTLCRACPDGILKSYNTTNHIWFKNITNSKTLAVILNTGAWFYVYKDAGGLEIYEDSLHKVGQACQILIKEHRIPCYWVSMPPVPSSYAVTPMYIHHPDWSSYSEKNEQAQRILSTYQGITFVDIESLLMQRKIVNPNVTADGLHWW